MKEKLGIFRAGCERAGVQILMAKFVGGLGRVFSLSFFLFLFFQENPSRLVPQSQSTDCY
jgi:hypothetical protein